MPELPVIADSAREGGEEKKRKINPSKEHVGSCQHRGGRGELKGGWGGTKEDRRLLCLAGVSLHIHKSCRRVIQASDRNLHNLIRYVHSVYQQWQGLGNDLMLPDPLMSADTHPGSKRPFSRRKTRKACRNPPRNGQYLHICA